MNHEEYTPHFLAIQDEAESLGISLFKKVNVTDRPRNDPRQLDIVKNEKELLLDITKRREAIGRVHATKWVTIQVKVERASDYTVGLPDAVDIASAVRPFLESKEFWSPDINGWYITKVSN